MYYYRLKDKFLFSLESYPQLEKATEEEVKNTHDLIYFLKNIDDSTTRRSYSLSHPQLIFSNREDLNLLQRDMTSTIGIPQWIIEKIHQREVMALNTAFSSWQEPLSMIPPKKWRINIAGLGDVGGTLLIGLRLLGGDVVESIGIYDRDINKLQRWEYEINQINGYQTSNLPPVKILEEKELFDCDAFVFCIAAHVPAIGEEAGDVRMAQLEANSKIINSYGNLARQSSFKGIFAVVSDPVDLLCKSLYIASNTDGEGNRDDKGLAPEQIRGYGLGVMNARALYYANQRIDTKHYASEGRAFGPHGQGLIIADSIDNYNQDISLYLTEMARTANLKVRETGFKPFIAPALSSGALSILDTLRGDWHYSATFMGGVYMGAKNRLLPSGIEIEILDLPPQLLERLQATYEELRSQL